MSHATTPSSHPHAIGPRLPIGPSRHESLAAGAVFVLNHSGGKDSQAMYAVVSSLVPHERIIVVHADLGEVEWPGVQDHIRANIAHELNVVKAVWRDGSEKHLLDMVRCRRRKLRADGRDASPFPSANQRFRTSDLKRAPVEKFIRGLGAPLVMNCLGLRAEESHSRAARDAWALNKRLSTAKRTVYDFLPIRDMTLDQVWRTIQASGQRRHEAYDLGASRLSCSFCLFASKADLTIAARARPALYRRYAALEQKTGYTLQPGRSLAETVAGAGRLRRRD